MSVKVGETQVTEAQTHGTANWNSSSPAWLHLQMTLETGEIGRQANGAVTLTYGDTVSPLRICALMPWRTAALWVRCYIMHIGSL